MSELNMIINQKLSNEKAPMSDGDKKLKCDSSSVQDNEIGRSSCLGDNESSWETNNNQKQSHQMNDQTLDMVEFNEHLSYLFGPLLLKKEKTIGSMILGMSRVSIAPSFETNTDNIDYNEKREKQYSINDNINDSINDNINDGINDNIKINTKANDDSYDISETDEDGFIERIVSEIENQQNEHEITSTFLEDFVRDLNSNNDSNSNKIDSNSNNIVKYEQQNININIDICEQQKINSDIKQKLDDEIKVNSSLGNGNQNVEMARKALKRPPKLDLIVSKNISEDLNTYTTSYASNGSMISELKLNSNPSLTMPQINPGEMIKKSVLGRGQFATVHLCLWKGVEVAVKEWGLMMDEDISSAAISEASTLAVLRHPCVIPFYGIVRDSVNIGIVIEYMRDGSLKKRLRQLKNENNKDFNVRKMLILIALQTARGMEFIHSRDMIHFDLKCDNLLCDLKDIESPIIKIGDVGLSKLKVRTFVSGNMRGTLPWMAPELLPDIKKRKSSSANSICASVNEKVDVYSFGIVMWEIWTFGDIPYKNMNSTTMLCKMMEGKLELEPINCDKEWSDLMYSCLSKQYQERPSFKDIVIHLENMLQKISQ